MKRKLLAIFFAIMLVLNACGSESKYSSINKMLDNGDYDGAIAEITKMKGQDQSNSVVSVSESTSDEMITDNNADNDTGIAEDNNATQKNEVEEKTYTYDPDTGLKFVTEEQVDSYIVFVEEVELTVDNYADYLECIEAEDNDYDGFGELVFERKILKLWYKEPWISNGEGVLIRFSLSYDYNDIRYDDGFKKITYKDSNPYQGTNDVGLGATIVTTYVKDPGYYREGVWTNITYTVEKVKGSVKIYDFLFPEDCWNIDDDGERYLAVKDNRVNRLYLLYENGRTVRYKNFTSIDNLTKENLSMDFKGTSPLDWRINTLISRGLARIH